MILFSFEDLFEERLQIVGKIQVVKLQPALVFSKKRLAWNYIQYFWIGG